MKGRRGTELDKEGRAKEEEEEREKNLVFFFTFITIGGWMYSKYILGYFLVIITF